MKWKWLLLYWLKLVESLFLLEAFLSYLYGIFDKVPITMVQLAIQSVTPLAYAVEMCSIKCIESSGRY